MAHREERTRTSGGGASTNGDETVAMPRPVLRGRNGDSSDERLRDAARGQIALIEGSTPHISAETRDLLRNRLRIAAVLFFVGFLAFLIRWAFYWDQWGGPEHRFLFYTHGLVTIILGGFAVKLCRHCSYSLAKLRLAELFIFGCPALFFVVKAVEENTYLANLPGDQARLENIVISWMLLIFCYAMFIPNTWQRAALVLGSMGLMPAAIFAYLYTLPAFSRL
ncbi:MAG: hypothetical protein WD229_11535, partial [Pirellulales bacterium]